MPNFARVAALAGYVVLGDDSATKPGSEEESAQLAERIAPARTADDHTDASASKRIFIKASSTDPRKGSARVRPRSMRGASLLLCISEPDALHVCTPHAVCPHFITALFFKRGRSTPSGGVRSRRFPAVKPQFSFTLDYTGAGSPKRYWRGSVASSPERVTCLER
jgi:hypothetical protein